MAINFFVYIMLGVSVLMMSFSIDTNITKQRSKNLPLVEFDQAIMYTMDEKEVTRIVKADKALSFKNKDEMYVANLVMRNNADKENLDILSANKVVQKRDNLYLSGDVVYNRGDVMQFKSKTLNYNTKTKIAKNKAPFWAMYNGNEFTGKNLYVDTNNNTILADKPKFIIVQEVRK